MLPIANMQESILDFVSFIGHVLKYYATTRNGSMKNLICEGGEQCDSVNLELA